MYSMELGGFDVVNQCISPVGEKEAIVPLLGIACQGRKWPVLL
jgi:hypothetical protein